jgi:hypothetical protein
LTASRGRRIPHGSYKAQSSVTTIRVKHKYVVVKTWSTA